MLLAALSPCLASLMLSSQPLAVQLPAAPDARVAGQVVDVVSRTPIPGATVVLIPTTQEFPPGAVTALEVVTNAKGEFMFLQLPPGRYRIEARKPGLAPVRDPSDAPTIDLAAGQFATGVELALQPGAVIAGRIVDARGGIPPLLRVAVLRQRTEPDGRTLTTTAQMAETNKRGEFRIEGLGEGNYLLIAAPPPIPWGAPPPPPMMVVGPTYYPGTADKETAQVVTVVSGQVVDDLQFSLILLPAHEVSGVVVDEAGAPLAGAIVALMADPAKGWAAPPAMGHTDQDGAFRIRVVSGTYQVMAEIGGPPMAKGGPSRSPGVGAVGGVFFGAVAPLEITVGDTDVTGLRIVLPRRGGTVALVRVEPEEVVRVEPEEPATLHVGETAAVRMPSEDHSIIGSAGNSLVLMEQTQQGDTRIYLYRAVGPGQQTLVATPRDPGPGGCISCVTVRYFITVVQ